MQCAGWDIDHLFTEDGKRKRRKKMPREQQGNDLREIAVPWDTILVITQAMIGHGCYLGLAAKYDGSVSLFAKRDKKSTTWHLLPMEDPKEVIDGIFEALGVEIPF